ncbi:MAG: selenium metabolism-associated LysR family transcriptional regulator [Eubacteriales bacterium]
MNLKQIEAFVQIAEGKSFSKAAKELYLTQPTISAHIASLEKELNVRLFVRNTKEVNLSPDGEILYAYATKMIKLQKEIEYAFGKEGKEEKQCIRVAASSINSQYILPDLMIQFCKDYVGEQFNIIETDSLGAIESVVNRNVDIGFVGTEIEKKNCKYIPFYSDELVIITPNTEKYSKLKNLSSVSIDWILEEAIIMREEGSGTRKEVEKQLLQCGMDLKALNVVASIENTETIKTSVAKGMGISMISKLAVEEEVASGKLLQFAFANQDSVRQLYVVYNKNFQLTHSTQRFLKVVKEIYKI